MRIITITPARLPQRVWLKFNDDSLLPLRVDDLVNLKITKLVELSPEQYAVIQQTSAHYLLYEYALRQLALSPKTKITLGRNLSGYSAKISLKYHFPRPLLQSLSAKVVNQIESQGLLNDAEFIRYYIHHHSRKSLTEIKFGLARLGLALPADFKPVVPEDDKIKAIIAKRAPHLDLADPKDKTRLLSYLYRKGFGLDSAKRLIDEWLKSR